MHHLQGEPIFSGSVSSVSDSNITFSTSIDDNNETVFPFFADGSFNKNVQVPTITAAINSGSVSSLTVTYPGAFDQNLAGFTNAPEIIISPSDGGGTSATATVSLGTGLSGKRLLVTQSLKVDQATPTLPMYGL